MNTISVSRITSRNYKNLRLNEGIELGALNILIGPNGSGKSNLVSLLRFLQECLTRSGGDEQRGRTNFEDAIYRLGGTRILDGNLNAPSNLDLEYRFPNDGGENLLGIELLVQGARHQVIVDREFLGRDHGLEEPYLFYNAHNEKSGGSGSGVVSVYNSPGEFDRAQTARSSHFKKVQDLPVNELVLSVFPKILENSPFSPDVTPLYGARGRILESVAGWKFYSANNMSLERIRESEPKLGQSDYYVAPSGENLALVVYNLVQDHFDFDESLNQVFRDILPLTRRIRAVSSGRLSLTMEWYLKGSSVPFFLDEMSDGTVRMLCWAVILNSPQPPSLIAIDEPEIGIHCSWMPFLAEWIKRAARKTQIIVSTHSPDLLDHFTDQLDSDGFIYAFQQDIENRSHYSPSRLSRDAVSGWLEEGWQLGDLYRVGNPAVGGWPW